MNKNKFTYLVILTYSLLIPKISAFLFILFGLYKFFTNTYKIISLYLIEIFLLFCFLSSYYIFGILYGFYSLENLIFFTFLGITGYIIGATLNLSSIKVFHIFLIITLGLAFYSFISTYQTYFSGNLNKALLNRTVYSIWDGVERNSPVFGAYGLFSLSFIIVLFLKQVNKYEKTLLLISIIFMIIMLILFQSRGPFLSAAIIFVLAYLYLKKYQNISLFKIKHLLISFVFIPILFFYFEDSIMSTTLISAYQERIEVVGAKSARFELWALGIEALFTQPFGGKEVLLKVGNYKSSLVHNTWLDISYATGIIPLLFILLFIFKHIRYIKFLFSKSQQCNDNIYFVVIGLAILLPTFFEPMVDASYIFISFIAFYLAFLKNYYYFKKGIK